MKKIIVLVVVLSLATLIYFNYPKGSGPVEVAKMSETPQVVRQPKLMFEDMTETSGIDFKHFNGAYGEKLLPETMGSGVAIVDIDNDGNEDVILVRASQWPWHTYQEAPLSSIEIYLNEGNAQFKQSPQFMIKEAFYGLGLSVADIDGNGFKEIYVTTLGENKLYFNDGKQLIEGAKNAGVSGKKDEWSSASSFFDVDNDGDLDLVVGNYIQWNKDKDLQVNYQMAGIGKAYGPPTDFSPSALHLYLNNGEGSFKDASETLQIDGQPNIAKALAIQPFDADDDGLLDFFVANDTSRNFFYHNLGQGKFKEMGEEMGVSYDSSGNTTGAMGTDTAYLGKNADQVLVVGNFANEMTSVYQRFAGDESFSDQSSILGVGADSRKSLTFGVLFADFDLDGREDLFQVNGHVESDINRVQASQSYEQPAQLFWNCGESCDSQFILSPLFLQEKWIGRGVAVSDLDKDGDLDLIVTQVSRKALVLINQTLKAGHWVGLLLADDNVKNKEAIGAKVQINTNLRSYLKLQMPTKGYLSQSSSRLVFGLEKDESLKEVVVTWPDGSQQQFNQLKIDQYNTLKKPSKKL